MLKCSSTLSGTFVKDIGCYCPGGCRGIIRCSSACICCQLHGYGCFWSTVTHITKDTRPKVIDAPLSLIFSMGQGRYLICQEMRPMILLWLYAMCYQSHYPGCMTKTHWRSIDAEFQDGAGRVSLSLLPIKAANNSFMTVCNLSTIRLHRMYDQTSLTLCWHSFSRCSTESVDMILSIKATYTSIVYNHNQIRLELPDLQDQKLLTLCWHSFAMRLSAIYNHLFWQSISFTLFWQLVYRFSWYSP